MKKMILLLTVIMIGFVFAGCSSGENGIIITGPTEIDISSVVADTEYFTILIKNNGIAGQSRIDMLIGETVEDSTEVQMNKGEQKIVKTESGFVTTDSITFKAYSAQDGYWVLTDTYKL